MKPRNPALPDPEKFSKNLISAMHKIKHQIAFKFTTAKKVSRFSDADICEGLKLSRQTVISIRTGKSCSLESLVAFCELMDMEVTIRAKSGSKLWEDAKS